jgi:16S rRNA U516 pseudouridylate synthase RsuA-like enzyme
VMHEGRKRQIRRIGALLGHPVRDLRRIRLGPLSLRDLEVGKWRYLTPQEIQRLDSLKRGVRKRKGRMPGRRPRRR